MTVSVRSPHTALEWKAYYMLRWQVLRAPLGLPLGSESDPSDKSALHAAAFDEAGNIVAVGRAHWSAQGTAQIRYMAVKPELQGKGLGQNILTWLELQVQQQGAQRIWLQARETAAPFYLKLGYTNKGPVATHLPTVPHLQMEKLLPNE